MARAKARAAGKRDELIKSEARERHLEDFIGLWSAAVKAWREMATEMHAKYEHTAEYEIISGLSMMLELEERTYRQNLNIDLVHSLIPRRCIGARKSMEPLTLRYGDNEEKAFHTNIVSMAIAMSRSMEAAETWPIQIVRYRRNGLPKAQTRRHGLLQHHA